MNKKKFFTRALVSVLAFSLANCAQSSKKLHSVEEKQNLPKIKIKTAEFSLKGKTNLIKWEKPVLEQGNKIAYYQIQRGNGTWTQVPVAETTSTSFADKKISPSIRYDYSVLAIDKKGNHVANTHYIYIEVPDYRPPAVPTIFAISDESQKENIPVAKLFFRVFDIKRNKSMSLLRKDVSGKIEVFPLITGDSLFFDEKQTPGQKYRYQLLVVGHGEQKVTSKEVEYETKKFKVFPVDKIEGWHDYRQGNVIKWYYFFPKHNDHYVLIYRREKSESTDFVLVNATPLPIKTHKYIDKVSPGSYEYHIVSTDVTGKIKSQESWPLFINVPAPN